MPVFTATLGSVSFLSQLFNPDVSLFSSSLHHTKLSNFCCKPPLLKSSSSSSSCSSSSLYTLKVSASSASTDAKIDNSEQTEAAANAVLNNSVSEDAIRQKRSADWKAARAYLHSGFIFGGKVEGFNNGEPGKDIHGIAKSLIGSVLSVKVIEAEEENRDLIFSEKEAVWKRFSKKINLGDIFEGRVGSVEDYGAFVHLRFPDGLYHLTGLVHITEVSWDLVQDVRDILTVGDDVRVKVLHIDRDKSRITLSIKQLEEDPLFETLEKVIPQDGSANPDFLNPSNIDIEPLPGLDAILEELLLEDGVHDVRISRQGFEKRVVSQDLQLWLSNAPPSDNIFTLLARAGRQVQEIQLATSLNQEGVKKALQRVLERVP